jgi:hypothetical protein
MLLFGGAVARTLVPLSRLSAAPWPGVAGYPHHPARVSFAEFIVRAALKA